MLAAGPVGARDDGVGASLSATIPFSLVFSVFRNPQLPARQTSRRDPLLVLKEAASIGGAPFYVILRSFIVLHFFYIPLPAIAAFTTARHVAFSVAFEGYVGIWNTPGVNPTPKNARRAEAASSSHRYPSRPGPHQRCVGIERFPILNQLGR